MNFRIAVSVTTLCMDQLCFTKASSLVLSAVMRSLVIYRCKKVLKMLAKEKPPRRTATTSC